MAFRIRGYRENHGEAMFIGITSTCMVVLWLVWIAGSITSTPHYRDGFIAFGVVANATLIFMIMFLPKGRQLAAVGREGHLDDRDQLSTDSSPSIYTPSFLHIKPMSQLIPLGKPSIAGLGTVVSGGGISIGGCGGTGGGYHLYKQFNSTGTTLTSPISTTAPVGPLSTGSAIPNSYSSHAIFNQLSNSNKVSQHQQQDEDANDPNYSNLSTIFATSANQNNNHSNLNSPISENNSSSSSRGGAVGSSQNSKSSSGKSGTKSSTGSHQQMIKSPINNSGKCTLFIIIIIDIHIHINTLHVFFWMASFFCS